MQVLILAGGLGTRLSNLTSDYPKCMIPINNKPFAEYQLKLFRRQGFREIIFCLGHLSDIVQNYFKDGREFDIDISYSIEKERLGTAGAIKLAEKFISGDFIVIHGDILDFTDFNHFFEFHRKNNGIITINLRKFTNYDMDTNITIMENYRITHYVQNPEIEMINKFQNKKKWVNNGIYIFKKEVLKYIPPKTKFDIDYNLIPLLLKNGEKLFGYYKQKYHGGIGTLKKYIKFKEDFKNIKKEKNDIFQGE